MNTLCLLCLLGARVAHLTNTGDRLDELPEKRFAPNDATRELVRGKDATLGHFVDHQVRPVRLAARKICAMYAPAQHTDSLIVHSPPYTHVFGRYGSLQEVREVQSHLLSISV